MEGILPPKANTIPATPLIFIIVYSKSSLLRALCFQRKNLDQFVMVSVQCPFVALLGLNHFLRCNGLSLGRAQPLVTALRHEGDGQGRFYIKGFGRRAGDGQTRRNPKVRVADYRSRVVRSRWRVIGWDRTHMTSRTPKAKSRR
jgi:hypothetical protein